MLHLEYIYFFLESNLIQISGLYRFIEIYVLKDAKSRLEQSVIMIIHLQFFILN